MLTDYELAAHAKRLRATVTFAMAMATATAVSVVLDFLTFPTLIVNAAVWILTAANAIGAHRNAAARLADQLRVTAERDAEVDGKLVWRAIVKAARSEEKN